VTNQTETVVTPRVDRIRDRLHAAFRPTRLDVVDDSHRHVGHPSVAADGRGHFTVVIVSASFAGMSKVDRHRAVYDAVQDLLATDIHAMSIHAFAPGEP
jgi:BolA family transcriptional regulator, general stress-responsive regulator